MVGFNRNRFKTFGLVALFFFLALLVMDYYQMKQGAWDISPGYSILFYSHISVIILLIITSSLSWFVRIDDETLDLQFHSFVVHGCIMLGLLNLSIISIGDVLISGSVAAYFGIIFCFAVVFILKPKISMIFFGINLVFMFSLLLTVERVFNLELNTQKINIVTFTVLATILSTMIYRNFKRDFRHRLIIERQQRFLEKSNKTLKDEIEERTLLNNEKEELIIELQKKIDQIQVLQGLVPICANCKKIRDDKGFWKNIESFIESNSDIQFSHSLCDDCVEKLYGDYPWYKDLKKD
jgi:hypothetical protein